MSKVQSLLCIDAGNTLVKWCVYASQTSESANEFQVPGEFFSHPTGAFKPFSAAADLLDTQLKHQVQVVDAVLLSNVLGLEFESAMRQFCDQHGLPLHVLTVNSNPAVQSLYENPASLGKDRWAACLAVSQISNYSINLLVSFGTATTVDALIQADRWQHLGGFIVPGVHTMLNSLHQNTAALPHVEPSQPHPAGPWPLNTEQAISEGVGRMQAAFVYSLVAELECQHSQTPGVWISGGYAAFMKNYLPQACLLEHAVFMGLVFDYQLTSQGAA